MHFFHNKTFLSNAVIFNQTILLLTWCLRELTFSNSLLLPQSKFIWNAILVPALKLDGYDALHSLMRNFSSEIIIDAIPRVTPDKVAPQELPSLSKDLFFTMNKCLRTVILPITSGLLHSTASSAMYELIDMALSSKFKSHSFTIDIIPSLVDGSYLSTLDKVENLDLYLSMTYKGDESYHKLLQAKAIFKFKSFILEIRRRNIG